MDNLYILSLRTQSAQVTPKEQRGVLYNKYWELSGSLHEHVKSYRTLLRAEYLKTFEES